MKKFFVFLVCLMIATTLTAYATENDPVLIAEDCEIIFENEVTLSKSIKNRIIDIVNRYILTDESAEHVHGASGRSLTCTLFGHDTTSELIFLVHHRVLDVNPRCEELHYLVTVCSRCDYSTYEYITERYISCCPEE